jgi:hypothetical protein
LSWPLGGCVSTTVLSFSCLFSTALVAVLGMLPPSCHCAWLASAFLLAPEVWPVGLGCMSRAPFPCTASAWTLVLCPRMGVWDKAFCSKSPDVSPIFFTYWYLEQRELLMKAGDHRNRSKSDLFLCLRRL